MKKGTIILVLSALVLFLLYKSRTATSGKKYKVITDVDFNYGYVLDQAGNQISFDTLAPQVGDIVEGDIKDGGLIIDLSFGPDAENKAKIFIPEENLQLL